MQQATFLGGGLDPSQKQKAERWYFEEKNCPLPIFVAGNVGCTALWYLSQRNILLFLSFLNTTTLYASREASGITLPPPPPPNPNRKLTEAKKAQLKLRNADRLLLATGNSLASLSWAVTFGLHTAKVLFPPNIEMAELWRATATPQVGVGAVLTAGMLYKAVVEARIAYDHRYD